MTKLRLDEWIAREFQPAPKIRTARAWVKDGKIFPKPVKLGRTYYVEEDAVFRDTTVRPRLADRISR